MSGCSGGRCRCLRRRTTSAPIPLGAKSLWPLTLIRSMRGVRRPSELLAEALGRVGVQEDVVASSSIEPVSDLLDRLADAGLVVHVHHADEQRVGPNRLQHARRSTAPDRVGCDVVDPEATLGETSSGSSTALCSIAVVTMCVRPMASRGRRDRAAQGCSPRSRRW